MARQTRQKHTRKRLPGWSWATCTVAVFVGLAISSLGAAAQLSKPPAATTTAPAAPSDPLRRETPRSAVEGLLRCAEKSDYVCITRFLQPVPGLDMLEVAKELQVLRSRFKGNIALLSNDPNGSAETGLPPGEERIGLIKVGGTSADVFLVRVDDPAYGKIWLVSSESITQFPELYARAQSEGPSAMERIVPAALREHRVLGMSLAKWIGWLLSIPLAWLLASLLTLVLSAPRRIWRAARGVELKTIWETNLGQPLTCILAILINGALIYLLEPLLLYREYYSRILAALLVGCLVWLVGRLADRGFEHEVNRRRTTGKGGEAILVLVQRANHIILLTIAIVSALALLGVNVTTTLAGLGIGGLAIALGAQKTLENLIGGISLLMDKAVHTGDFCEIGGKLGTVEDIGLRSLRLRTLDQNLLVVPNALLAQMQFQNFKGRKKLLISQNFSLRIETPLEQLRTVLDGIQRMLDTHSSIESGTSRVRVVQFAGSAFDLELWAYVTTGDWVQFTAIRQDVILKITGIIEAAGTRLAAPTRLTYLSGNDDSFTHSSSELVPR